MYMFNVTFVFPDGESLKIDTPTQPSNDITFRFRKGAFKAVEIVSIMGAREGGYEFWVKLEPFKLISKPYPNNSTPEGRKELLLLKINQQMKVTGDTVLTLSKKMFVHKTAVYRWLKGKASLDMPVVLKLEEVLGIKLLDV